MTLAIIVLCLALYGVRVLWIGSKEAETLGFLREVYEKGDLLTKAFMLVLLSVASPFVGVFGIASDLRNLFNK